MAKGTPKLHTCPKCGKVTNYTSWEYINNHQDAVLLPKIEDLSLFLNFCPECGTGLYPDICLLYQDMDMQIIIYYVDGPNKKELKENVLERIEKDRIEGYKYRIVENKTEFAEKVGMLRHGFDDRVAAMGKWAIFHTAKERQEEYAIKGIWFETNENGEPTFRITYEEDMERVMVVTSEMYAQFMDMFWDVAEMSGEEIFANDEWALFLFWEIMALGEEDE